ncbi:MAG: DNA-processing protein DprA [Pseudomonadota bacterium]
MKRVGALSEQAKLDWLQLSRTPRVGPVTFFQLLSRFGSAADALKALPTLAKRGKSKPPRPPSRQEVESEYQSLQEYGAGLLCACEDAYPERLAACGSPPPVLTVLGNIDLLKRPALAIVGARDASAAGRKIARDIAMRIGLNDYVIVSGLARGIDGEVHAASLKSGTVAVLGGGIDHIYPSQHDRLYAEIAANGLIVSESPFGYRAQARDFPRRNRIITGLADGVLVVEAAERSGSLISARTAGEQGRDVMAVPGSPLDPRAAGTNRLLKEGAALVRNAEDVLDVLSSFPSRRIEAPPMPDYETETDDIPESQYQAVLTALTPYPMPIADLAEAAGLSARRCAAILTELELSGDAVTLSGGLAHAAV